MLPKTFCALPFYQTTISNDGKGRLCQHSLMPRGQFLSLHQTTFGQIWNSDYLRSVRSRMIEGTEIEDCVTCYKTECDGGTSLRRLVNSGARNIFEVSGDDQILEKAEAIVRDHGGNAPPPSGLSLWLGNHCNLKCRMCSPEFSSQIGSDVVHSKWRSDVAQLETPSRITENPDWSKNEKIIFEEIFEHVECLKQIQFFGGEPLIHPMFPKILEKLVDTGHAAHIEVYIASNGTRHSSHLSALLRKFSSVTLDFSVDGVGKLQEYIRPPSKWDIISRNILDFQKENVPVSVYSTVQAYNIFGLLDLARWCRKYGLPFSCHNVLFGPSALSLDMLPQDVINEALEDWMKYLETECTEDNRWRFETVIASLRRPRPEAGDLSIFQDEFIRFTNDLDRSRGQSFATACPRLHDRLVTAGFDFHGKYHFSQPEEISSLRDQLGQSQEAISNLRDQLSQSQAEVKGMKSSKFWKIRSLWFSIKQKFGLGV